MLNIATVFVTAPSVCKDISGPPLPSQRTDSKGSKRSSSSSRKSGRLDAVAASRTQTRAASSVGRDASLVAISLRSASLSARCLAIGPWI